MAAPGRGKDYIPKETVEQTLRLDIRWCLWMLRRNEPWVGTVSLYRTRPREQIEASCKFFPKLPGGQPGLALAFGHREKWGTLVVRDVISFAGVPTRIGGQRWRFVCPDCSCRCDYLYAVEVNDRGVLVCRGCAMLSYESQRAGPSRRARAKYGIHQQDKLPDDLRDELWDAGYNV
jgi:hypothetical protein